MVFVAEYRRGEGHVPRYSSMFVDQFQDLNVAKVGDAGEGEASGSQKEGHHVLGPGVTFHVALIMSLRIRSTSKSVFSL